MDLSDLVDSVHQNSIEIEIDWMNEFLCVSFEVAPFHSTHFHSHRQTGNYYICILFFPLCWNNLVKLIIRLTILRWMITLLAYRVDVFILTLPNTKLGFLWDVTVGSSTANSIGPHECVCRLLLLAIKTRDVWKRVYYRLLN